ncbi:cell division protein PerM [Bifidobacterium aesculapii]|uniref:cell division protein PerM n=1 Tax=Bifidobacterium aesculapii TaxID=1329411 RepID=UPI000AF316E3|nr:DUF6350 family protein [Bifidobacterium aesculapii]
MTSPRVRALFKGVVASLGAMALYAISLGCFIALMLLVISMEEGGENLPSSTMPLTEMVILLSQGVGFTAGSIVLTIMPLLLTILLVALVAQCAARGSIGVLGWLSGLVVWTTVNLIIAGGPSVELHDSPVIIAVKTSLVWTVGCLLSAPHASSEALARLREWIAARVPHKVLGLLFAVAAIAGLLFAAVLVISTVVCVFWIIRGWPTMTTLFSYDGMENGSRVLTSLASAAWLPNLIVWAASWIIGEGFHIGELATFTMWGGQSAGLPPLPVFGLMPEAISDEHIRIALQCMAPAAAFVIGMFAMLIPGDGRVRPVRPGDTEGTRRLVAVMARHLAAFLLALACATGAWMLCFLLSDGALGTRRLAHVGVDVTASGLAMARLLAYGLGTAWLAVMVVVSGIYGIHWIIARRSVSRNADAVSDPDGRPDEQPAGDGDGTADDESGAHDAEHAPQNERTGRAPASERRMPRSIRSDRSVRTESSDEPASGKRRAARTVRSSVDADTTAGDMRARHDRDQSTKEETDDNN